MKPHIHLIVAGVETAFIDVTFSKFNCIPFSLIQKPWY